MAFPYVVDATSDVARAFGAAKTPEAFLFDKHGKLVYHGAIDDNAKEPKQVKERYLQTRSRRVAGGRRSRPRRPRRSAAASSTGRRPRRSRAAGRARRRRPPRAPVHRPPRRACQRRWTGMPRAMTANESSTCPAPCAIDVPTMNSVAAVKTPTSPAAHGMR